MITPLSADQPSLFAAPAPAAPELRPYQIKAVNEILACIQRKRHPLFALPTGGGKSVILAAVARVVAAHGYETWLFAHRRELIRQLSDHLRAVGLRHGIIAPDEPLTDDLVQICSIDTVRARRQQLVERMKRVRLMVVDECHHATSRSYSLAIEGATSALRLGVTATPFRLDGAPLGDLFNEAVRGPSPVELERMGFIAPVDVIAPPAKVNLSNVRKRLGDFVVSQIERAVNTDEVTQAAIVAYAKHCGGIPTIAYCTTVKHAEDCAAAFAAAGWSVDVIEGRMKKTDRDSAISGLARGRHQILFSVECVSEGVDCLDAETEILTPRGWLGVNDLSPGDAVYSYDTDSHRIVSDTAERVVARPVRLDERMVSIESQHTNIRVTEGHRLFYRKRGRGEDWLNNNIRWSTAGALARDAQPFAIPICGEADFPGVDLTDDELRFIAWFVTDGWRQRTYIGISQSKPFHTEIRALLGRLGFSFRERLREAASTNYPNSKPAYEFLVPRGTHTRTLQRGGWDRLGEYLNKDISPLLSKMTRSQFNVFWDELMKGDGSRPENKSGQLVTGSKLMADRLSAMAILRGRSCSVHCANSSSTGNPVWYLRSSDRAALGRSDWFVFAPKDKRGARFDIMPAEPGERVWCITTARGTLIARRRGKIAILGNCPVVGAGLMLRPTASTGLFLQQCGRLRRIYPGKDKAILLDLVGNWTRHGLPNADRPWGLKQSVQGLERAVAAVRRCGACHHVAERGPERCPRCGRKYPVRVTRAGAPSEAALTTMPGLAGLSAFKIAQMSLGTLLPMAKTRDDLEIVAAIRGYRAGWVDHVLRERAYRARYERRAF